MRAVAMGLMGCMAGVWLAGCATDSSKPEVADTSGPGRYAEPQVYDCGNGIQFTIAMELKQAWLVLPERNVRLLPVESPAGLQYKGEGVTFWAQEGQALLVLPTERHTDCVFDPRASVWAKGKLQGVDFRAVGNEPGWYLEINEGVQIVLVADYGSKWHEFGAPAPQVDAARGITRYRANNEGRSIDIEILNKVCTDDMSGETFEATVRVQLDQKTYRGCGRRL